MLNIHANNLGTANDNSKHFVLFSALTSSPLSR